MIIYILNHPIVVNDEAVEEFLVNNGLSVHFAVNSNGDVNIFNFCPTNNGDNPVDPEPEVGYQTAKVGHIHVRWDFPWRQALIQHTFKSADLKQNGMM